MQGVAQVLFHGASLLQRMIHAALEQAEPAAAVLLGTVQCDVGVLEQYSRGIAVVRVDGNPDAGTDADILSVDTETPGQAIDQAACQPAGMLDRYASGLQHHKFVATDAGDNVASRRLSRNRCDT